jgi:hypothetical protein
MSVLPDNGHIFISYTTMRVDDKAETRTIGPRAVLLNKKQRGGFLFLDIKQFKAYDVLDGSEKRKVVYPLIISNATL